MRARHAGEGRGEALCAGGVGRLAPARATPLPRRWLYPAVNGGSPRRGRDADAVVLKSSLWKQDGEDPGR